MGRLLPSHQKVAMVLEVVQIERWVRVNLFSVGRPSHCRRALARAFLAKAVLNIPTTRDLVERLGLDARLRRVVGFVGRVPSEATFSRAFAEFAASGLSDEAHEEATRKYLAQEIVFHASVDASTIPARERGARKVPKVKAEPQKRGRKPGQQTGERTKPLAPQEQQLRQSVPEMLFAMPRVCDHGLKIGPRGYLVHWQGYKAHASIGDEGIPLAFLTSSASLHDSLGAIPLLKLAGRRARILYDLMDKAYLSGPIEETVRSLEQVAIVPPKKLRKDDPKPELTPDRKKRYRNRTTVERFFADLKDNHGGNHLFVKGGEKVHAHLMMGVLAIFGLRILRL